MATGVVGSERGTTNFDVLDSLQLYVKGTMTGSVAKVSTGNFTDLYGSVITGSGVTLPGSSITSNELLSFQSGITQVSTTDGTIPHGLGTTPAFISILPCDADLFEGYAVGLVAGTNADDTNIYVTSGTTGTVVIYALA